MSKFSETVTESTPRLEVRYKLIDGNDQYEWGIVSNIPLLSLIGGITRSQVELHACDRQPDQNNRCAESKFILAWYEEYKSFNWYVNPDIPTDSLIGMLETIKLAIVMSIQARRAAAQQYLVLPNSSQQSIILPGRG